MVLAKVRRVNKKFLAIFYQKNLILILIVFVQINGLNCEKTQQGGTPWGSGYEKVSNQSKKSDFFIFFRTQNFEKKLEKEDKCEQIYEINL